MGTAFGVDPARPARPGDVVAGRYELIELVGQGATGQVFAAQDLRLGRRVAVKMLRPNLAGHSQIGTRFANEARLAAKLNTPSAVAVYDCGESGGASYLVMELLSGRTLADVLADRTLAADEVRSLGAVVLDALGAAHAAGMLHRDIKPRNVLVTDDGGWKLADFGIAKSLGRAEGDATTTGIVIGTPGYLAPERIAGGPATIATDIYACGVLLYESLSGRRRIEEETLSDRSLGFVRSPIAELCPWVPSDLAAVVSKAMANDPADRFVDAPEMAMALRNGEPPDPTLVLPSRLAGDTAPILAPTQAIGSNESGRAAPLRSLVAAPRRALILAVLAVLIVVAVVVATQTGGGSGTPRAETPAPRETTVAPGTTSSATLPAPLNAALSQLAQSVAP